MRRLVKLLIEGAAGVSDVEGKEGDRHRKPDTAIH